MTTNFPQHQNNKLSSLKRGGVGCGGGKKDFMQLLPRVPRLFCVKHVTGRESDGGDKRGHVFLQTGTTFNYTVPLQS